MSSPQIRSSRENERAGFRGTAPFAGAAQYRHTVFLSRAERAPRKGTVYELILILRD